MSKILRRFRKPVAVVAVAVAAAATVGAASAFAAGPTDPPGVEPQIIGGGEASEPYSWMTTLGFIDGKGENTTDLGHQCGATLVFRGWVVTAAHCVADPPANLTAAQRDELAARYPTLIS